MSAKARAPAARDSTAGAVGDRDGDFDYVHDKSDFDSESDSDSDFDTIAVSGAPGGRRHHHRDGLSQDLDDSASLNRRNRSSGLDMDMDMDIDMDMDMGLKARVFSSWLPGGLGVRQRRRATCVALAAFVLVGVVLVTVLVVAAAMAPEKSNGAAGEKMIPPSPATQFCVPFVPDLTFFLAAEDVLWDFAPAGRSAAAGRPFSPFENQYIEADCNSSGNRITAPQIGARAIHKARVVQFSDASFRTSITRPTRWAHLGLLGPALEVSAGDRVQIVFKNALEAPKTANAATFQAGLRAHGSFSASTAGCPQQSDTDDSLLVPPGDTIVYNWTVPLDAGPAPGREGGTVLWLYHGAAAMGPDAGLVGPIMVSAPRGSKLPPTVPIVDVEFVAMFMAIDESASPFLEHNLAAVCTNPSSVDRDSLVFLERCLKYSINGYLFGSTAANYSAFNISHPPTLFEFNVGQRVRWHIIGLGNGIDIHTPHWHGSVVEYASGDRRADVIDILPAEVVDVDMVADNAGTWLFHCHVNEHLETGMQTLYRILNQTSGPASGTAALRRESAVTRTERRQVVRRFFVAAELVSWDYAPSGQNAVPFVPQPFSAAAKVFVAANNATDAACRVGTQYVKAVYRAYTDSTFVSAVKLDSHAGIFGQAAMLRARVGEQMVVEFFNRNVPFPVSMHPHGVLYTKANEGAPYVDGDQGDTAGDADSAVAAGQRYIYTWEIPLRAGPPRNASGHYTQSTQFWMFHSHTDEASDTNAGLIGTMVIGADDDSLVDPLTAIPRDVDTEISLFLTVFDENKSPLLGRTVRNSCLGGLTEAMASDSAFIESNQMHAINGLIFGNLDITLNVGARIRWYVFGMGNEIDVHPLHWTGNELVTSAVRTDTVSVLAANMQAADMIASEPGRWLMSCHADEHRTGGMSATYTVSGTTGPLFQPERQLRFYLSIEEQDWDYAPEGSVVDGDPTFSRQDVRNRYCFWFCPANTSVRCRVGSRYTKARFIAYSDASYSTRLPEDKSLGILGPTLRVRNGDLVHVYVRNTARFPFNFHAHGLRYNNSYDITSAAGFQKDRAARAANSSSASFIYPGKQFTYTFAIPRTPGAQAERSVVRPYHSTVDNNGIAGSDIYAGLVGAFLIESDLEPVEREYITLFNTFDENSSPFAEANFRNAQCDASDRVADTKFFDSNLMHGINGLSLGNLQGLIAVTKETIRWHVLGLGKETDIHTAHWHGITGFAREIPSAGVGGATNGAPERNRGTVLRTDAVDVFPSTTRVVEMAPTNDGRFLFHCHVRSHFQAGQVAFFDVHGE